MKSLVKCLGMGILLVFFFTSCLSTNPTSSFLDDTGEWDEFGDFDTTYTDTIGSTVYYYDYKKGDTLFDYGTVEKLMERDHYNLSRKSYIDSVENTIRHRIEIVQNKFPSVTNEVILRKIAFAMDEFGETAVIDSLKQKSLHFFDNYEWESPGHYYFKIIEKEDSK